MLCRTDIGSVIRLEKKKKKVPDVAANVLTTSAFWLLGKLFVKR